MLNLFILNNLHKFEDITMESEKVEKTGFLKQAPNLLTPFALFKKTVESDARILNLNYRKGLLPELILVIFQHNF